MKSSFLSLSSHDLSSTDSDGLDNLSKRSTYSMALVVLMRLAIWGCSCRPFSDAFPFGHQIIFCTKNVQKVWLQERG